MILSPDAAGLFSVSWSARAALFVSSTSCCVAESRLKPRDASEKFGPPRPPSCAAMPGMRDSNVSSATFTNRGSRTFHSSSVTSSVCFSISRMRSTNICWMA